MKDRDLMMLLGIAGLALLTRRRGDDVTWDNGWVWPVPPLRPWKGGPVYNPEVSQEFKPGTHLGVDIMYRRKSRQDLIRSYPPGSPDGTPNFFAPPRTPIIAARAGRIWSCEKTARGWAVVLDHSKPFATFYQHLETPAFPIHRNGVSVNTGQPTFVTVGQPLGTMGYDPTDGERLRHLHFAVWYQGAGDDASIDCTSAMLAWPRVPWAFTP